MGYNNAYLRNQAKLLKTHQIRSLSRNKYELQKRNKNDFEPIKYTYN